jgi:hypothetical protein
MTALAKETITTASAGADQPEASEVFHVEHRCGRTGHRVELARTRLVAAKNESFTDNGWMASSAFCWRSLSFSTPHWGPARRADVVLVSHSKSMEARVPHDRNEQTTMADQRRQPTPRRPGAVAPAPAWSWRGTRYLPVIECYMASGLTGS